MKKPDAKTLQMLQEELSKIITEVNDESGSVAERFEVVMLVVEITTNVRGFSAGVRRKTHEILYRYYSMIEGLEKK